MTNDVNVVDFVLHLFFGSCVVRRAFLLFHCSFSGLSFFRLNDGNSDFPLLTWKSVNIVIIDRKHFPPPNIEKTFTHQKRRVLFLQCQTHTQKERKSKRNPIRSLENLSIDTLSFFATMIEVWLANVFSAGLLCFCAMNEYVCQWWKLFTKFDQQTKSFQCRKKITRECCDKLGRFLYVYWRCGGIILHSADVCLFTIELLRIVAKITTKYRYLLLQYISKQFRTHSLKHWTLSCLLITFLKQTFYSNFFRSTFLYN